MRSSAPRSPRSGLGEWSESLSPRVFTRGYARTPRSRLRRQRVLSSREWRVKPRQAGGYVDLVLVRSEGRGN